MSAPKLSPCPFCGGSVRLVSQQRPGYETCPDDPDARAHFFVCNSCACQGPWSKSESSAIRLWNMRVPT